MITEGLSLLVSAVGGVRGGKETKEEVVRCFRTTHRTLQQLFVGLIIIPILQHLAANYRDNVYDARNEASVKLAAKLLAAVSEDDLFLPYI